MINEELKNKKDNLIFELSKEKINCQIKEVYISLINDLKDKNCSLGYINKNAKKNGHLKVSLNVLTKEYNLEIKINKNDNVAGQIYTLVHEMTHLINDHLFLKELTKKQSEVVADTVAVIIVKKIKLFDLLSVSMVSKKWNINEYSNYYIDTMRISREKIDLIEKQIITSVEYFINIIKI